MIFTAMLKIGSTAATLALAVPASAGPPPTPPGTPGSATSDTPPADCCALVETLLRQLESTGDVSPESAFTLVTAAELLHQIGGNLAGLAGRIPETATGDAWTIARARLLHLDGRNAEAAALLEPLARPRHHTLPRWSIVHEHLGDVYAAMGRAAAAEGQWRVALATGYSPEGSGWDPTAVEAKLAAASAEGAAPVVPVTHYPDAVYLIDLASIRPSASGVRYEKIELLLTNEDDAAYSRFAREIDCGNEARARVEWRRRYGTDGREIAAPAIPDGWQPIRHDDPWLHTERRLACEFPQGVTFRADEMNDLERLRAVRRGVATAD
jgi:hypothetical protein